MVNLTQNFDVYVNLLGRSDTINGLSGDDIISGRDGNDMIDGGAGFDIANYMDDYEAKGIKASSSISPPARPPTGSAIPIRYRGSRQSRARLPPTV